VKIGRKTQIALSAAALLVALAFLAIGVLRSHVVLREEAPPADAMPPPSLIGPGGRVDHAQVQKFMEQLQPRIVEMQIGDRELVRNATFTGVARRDGVLVLTYDPATATGKQACPT